MERNFCLLILFACSLFGSENFWFSYKVVTENKILANNDNIKWDVDFRTAYDIVDYKVNDLMGLAEGSQSNSVWTNKLTLGMAAQPVDNLVFKGALGFYKAFGQSNISTR